MTTRWKYCTYSWGCGCWQQW